MVSDVNSFHRKLPGSLSEYTTIADHADGRRSIRAQLGGQRPASFPGAALKKPRERKRSRIQVQPSAHFTHQFIEQCNGQRAPFDYQWRSDVVITQRICRIPQDQNPRIHEQPAVAILSKTGKPIDVSYGIARPLQRLYERIGKPLRQLVQRDEAVRGVLRPQQWMWPTIAQRNCPKHLAKWPN